MCTWLQGIRPDLAYFLAQVPGQPSLLLVIKPSVPKTSSGKEAQLTRCLCRKRRLHRGFVRKAPCSCVPHGADGKGLEEQARGERVARCPPCPFPSEESDVKLLAGAAVPQSSTPITGAAPLQIAGGRESCLAGNYSSPLQQHVVHLDYCLLDSRYLGK